MAEFTKLETEITAKSEELNKAVDAKNDADIKKAAGELDALHTKLTDLETKV
jgi:hypothetical protein